MDSNQNAIEEANDAEWWREHDNLVLLTAYMADMDQTAKEVAHAVEKPWKYTDFYVEAQEWAAE